jgi:hypothetical protein
MPIPEWLAAALVAAALATLGFVGKQILEFIVSIRTAAHMRRARLVTLLSLLTGTAAVFRVQTVLSRRLCHLMTNRDPTLGKIRGYEAIFAAAFPKITPEERELHSIIRGYTINGIKPLNESMIEWLKADTEFKLPRSRRGPRRELARLLSELEAHLLMWLAKYSAWTRGRRIEIHTFDERPKNKNDGDTPRRQSHPALGLRDLPLFSLHARGDGDVDAHS